MPAAAGPPPPQRLSGLVPLPGRAYINGAPRGVSNSAAAAGSADRAPEAQQPPPPPLSKAQLESPLKVPGRVVLSGNGQVVYQAAGGAEQRCANFHELTI